LFAAVVTAKQLLGEGLLLELEIVMSKRVLRTRSRTELKEGICMLVESTGK
jgi:hypothetical protein